VLNIIFNSFPDLHQTIEDIISEREKVWIRATITAIHTGESRGLNPIDNKFTESVVWTYWIIDDDIAEGWEVQDELDFYKKMDAIKYTKKGTKLFPEDTI
jgi:predicted ester cyclase